MNRPRETIVMANANPDIVIKATPEALIAVLPDGTEEQRSFEHIEDIFALPLRGVANLASKFMEDVRARYEPTP